MSATAATTFPTAGELAEAARMLNRSFSEVERIEWQLRRIVKAFVEGDVLDEPTFETIGVLADFVDSVETEATQLAEKLAELRGHLREVMMMRGDLEARRRNDAE